MAGITETKNRLPNEFVNNLYEMFTPGMVDNIFRGIAEKRLTTLRVNTLKYDIQSLMKYFKEINIKSTKSSKRINKLVKKTRKRDGKVFYSCFSEKKLAFLIPTKIKKVYCYTIIIL